ncbi:hypothetical protein ABNV59_000483, partial [Campylobacter jejuni]
MTIESGGTLQASGYSSNANSYAIELKGSNGNTRTLEKLINEGTIQGKIGVENGDGFNGTITVKNFENKKTIDGHIEMQLNNNNNKGT